jgi:hypothetical protein
VIARRRRIRLEENDKSGKCEERDILAFKGGSLAITRSDVSERCGRPDLKNNVQSLGRQVGTEGITSRCAISSCLL